MGVFSFIGTGLSWCFCSACGSLVGSCCGNDKASNVAPGAFSGRKRSVFLLLIAIAIAFAFQYGVAPIMFDYGPNGINQFSYITEAWWDGCEDYGRENLQKRCIGNSGVYRSGFSSVVFYLFAGVAVALSRTANRVAWPAKYVLFLFLAAGTCFIPNQPLFSEIFLNVARAGSVLFIILEQIIFIDLAHNWNEGWIIKHNEAEAEEAGSGQKWLKAIIATAIFLFVASIVGWGLLFHFYGGCPSNVAFVSITIILCVIMTIVQLSGEEGSFLASSIITAYTTSLCYTAVARNPDEECNPFLGEENVLGIIIGITYTILSLTYAGWSWTADQTLGGSSEDDETGESQPEKEEPKGKVTGIVANVAEEDPEADEEETEEYIPNTFSNNWKLNFVLAIVSCWFTMALTSWGSIEDNEGGAANPQTGKVTMWIIIASQWLAFLLYLWTLSAPRLFPDRDFS